MAAEPMFQINHNIYPPSRLTDSKIGGIFIEEGRIYEMELKPGEKVWVPEKASDLVCILKPGELPPKTTREYLANLNRTMGRLVEEADPMEVEEAEEYLREGLPYDLEGLPAHPLTTPEARGDLLNLVNGEGDQINDFREWVAKVIANPGPPMSEKDAILQLDDLSLDGIVEYLI